MSRNVGKARALQTQTAGYEVRDGFSLNFDRVAVQVDSAWPPVIRIRTQVAQVDMCHLMAQHSERLARIEFLMNCDPHFVTRVAPCDGGEPSVRRGQPFEVHSNSISHGGILNGAFKKRFVPHPIKLCKLV